MWRFALPCCFQNKCDSYSWYLFCTNVWQQTFVFSVGRITQKEINHWILGDVPEVLWPWSSSDQRPRGYITWPYISTAYATGTGWRVNSYFKFNNLHYRRQGCWLTCYPSMTTCKVEKWASWQRSALTECFSTYQGYRLFLCILCLLPQYKSLELFVG